MRSSPVLKIASWNINGVKARLARLLGWLQQAAPDVVVLQELKSIEENFPELEIGDLGYNTAVLGQKSFNGVAILSKRPIEDVTKGLSGDPDDEQARYIEAVTGGVRVASIYLPNGNPIDSEKFTYKLDWLERLYAHTQSLLELEEAFVLGGDYNVIPSDADVYDPEAFAEDALCQPESRAGYRKILNLGVVDAFRALHGEVAYTYWDYQRGRWQRDEGIRIDHLLLSPQAADRLSACDIDRGPRAQQKPSDHTPIWCELEDEEA
ncbi:MAG: exodeoxyribonuclease III [Alphaproteobacteria bacterium]